MSGAGTSDRPNGAADAAAGGDPIEAFTSGRSIPVAIGAIEQELSRFWREASRRARGAGSHLAVTRTCLWNLVIRADGDEAFVRLKKLVDDLSPTLPARVLVLRPRPNLGEARLLAWVEANCRVGRDGEREICAEEVTIEADGEAVERIPSVVRELLVPDVPAALYWPGDPPDDTPSITSAIEAVDRLILDTEGLWNPSALGGLVRLLHTHPALEICDLGWMRLLPLRLAAAGLLDPPRGGVVFELDRLTVDCLRHREPAGLLFLGWIVDRLHLRMARAITPVEGSAASWLLGRPEQTGKEITVVLRVLDDAPASEAGLVSVELRAPSATLSARIAASAPGEDGELRIEANAPSYARSERESRPSEADLVALALGAHGCDPLYSRVLSRATELTTAQMGRARG